MLSGHAQPDKKRSRNPRRQKRFVRIRLVATLSLGRTPCSSMARDTRSGSLHYALEILQRTRFPWRSVEMKDTKGQEIGRSSRYLTAEGCARHLSLSATSEG